MLRRSFIHLPGVGRKREQAIWQAGIRDWEDFLARGEQCLPPALFRMGRPVVRRSLAALGRGEAGLAELAEMFPTAEHWRLVTHYSRLAFLDIETGGDPAEWGGITVVGVYAGGGLRQYLAGRDLHQAAHALAGYHGVVTFGGASFDLPVLRRVFGNLVLPPLHLDLYRLLRRLGLRGGLKRIERRLGISRPPEVEGLNGWDAVRLWREYMAGRRGALELLLRYNACDARNLEPLLAHTLQALTAHLMGRPLSW